MNNADLEELGTEDIMIEQLAEPVSEQPTQYNLSNLYRPKSQNSRTVRKGLVRSGASRNVIKNTLGFKNPLATQRARHLNMPEQGTVSYAQAPIRHTQIRSSSPKAKKIGGRKRRTCSKLRSRRRRN